MAVGGRRPGFRRQRAQIVGDFVLLAVAQLNRVVGRAHQPAVVGNYAFVHQPGRRPQINGLRHPQTAAEFLGRRAPAQRILVVVRLQRHLGLVPHDVPPAPRVGHGVSLGTHLAQHHYVAFSGQDAQAFQDFFL